MAVLITCLVPIKDGYFDIDQVDKAKENKIREIRGLAKKKKGDE